MINNSKKGQNNMEKYIEIDAEKYPFLYSVGTKFANVIDRRYYGDVHFVWCTLAFNSKTQPPSSNPFQIAKRWLQIVTGADTHITDEIKKQKAGVIFGSKAKYNAGIITKKDKKEIGQMINLAEYKDFLPVIYVIDTKKVNGRIIEVNSEDRANDVSVEYKIIDLAKGEFELVDLYALTKEFLEIKDRKVGE